MSAAPKPVSPDPAPARRPAYDPNNLSPMDLEDRQYDDTSESIDWDEIIATTQDDWEARRYKLFKSTDYPTEEALIQALEQSRSVTPGQESD